MACPICKGEVEYISGDYGTGVFAPDGSEEVRWEEGYYCPRCGRAFSVEDCEDYLCEPQET